MLAFVNELVRISLWLSLSGNSAGLFALFAEVNQRLVVVTERLIRGMASVALAH